MSLPFIIIAVVTLFAAAAAMSLRNLVHCALSLVVALAGLAALYLALDAQFVGFANPGLCRSGRHPHRVRGVADAQRCDAEPGHSCARLVHRHCGFRRRLCHARLGGMNSRACQEMRPRPRPRSKTSATC